MIPFPYDPHAAQALESLRQRISTAPDPAPCLAPEALHEAAVALLAARGGPEERPVADLVARFLHGRYAALPRAESRTSLVRAVALLVPFARSNSEVGGLLKDMARTVPELPPTDPRAHPRTPGPAFGRSKALRAEDLMKKHRPTSADAPDLRHAIELFHQSLEDPSATSSERAERLHGLALALETREKLSGDPADLESVIRAWRDAAETAPAGTPERGLCLHGLSGALDRRFQSRGRMADLDEAVRTARAACVAVAEGHKHLPTFQNSLSLYLCRRSKLSGSRTGNTDLAEAVDAARTALRTAGPNHQLQQTFLSTLTKALHTRFQSTGDWRDLREAMGLGAPPSR